MKLPKRFRRNERIILKWISEFEGGVEWIHRARDRDQWRYLVNNNEDSGSVKCREFLECLNSCCFLKRGHAIGDTAYRNSSQNRKEEPIRKASVFDGTIKLNL
jgi:hypothetical protein